MAKSNRYGIGESQMKASTVKGMNDYLPKEVRMRQHLQDVIVNTYQSCGFERIMTPIIEDIENLNKSEGGDNLNLIFKIMKRGDKLDKAIAQGKYDEIADMGLRYDLTLPLSRYYANNKDKLMTPMKCIQVDRVYRAERPQKGRLREFIQCDIDIIGTTSYTAEVELMNTTAKALLNIGLKNFKIKVNDRQLLRSILMTAGFEEAQLDSVCITFDKLDKIGVEGVKAELEEKGFATEAIANLCKALEVKPFTIEAARELCQDTECIDRMEKIIAAAKKFADGRYQVEYEMSLVRGQGYYTGTVFEVESLDFKGAVAGGGRYDNLIGKFLNESVPAVGFSIGFERIFSILTEMGYEIPDQKKRVAVLFEEDDFMAAAEKAEELRAEYDVAMFVKPKKVGKYLDKLKDQGYNAFWNFGQSEELKELS